MDEASYNNQAMPNSLISLLDQKDPLTVSAVLKAMEGVPFMKHQFRWLVGEVVRGDGTTAERMMAGYAGVKKLDARRKLRIAEAVGLIKTLTATEVAQLPSKVTLSGNLGLKKYVGRTGNKSILGGGDKGLASVVK
jgi:hypothetical protein